MRGCAVRYPARVGLMLPLLGVLGLGTGTAAGLTPDTGAAHPAHIIVAPAGEVRSLAAAVGRAHPGDTILVLPGRYRTPPTVIDRPLAIVGRPGAVLESDAGHPILIVRADDVLVAGLTLRGVGVSFVEDRAAVRTDSVRGCRIEGNRIENSFFGIDLARTARCVVSGNVIVGPHASSETLSGNGIHLWYAREIELVGNHVSGQRDGIYLEFVAHSRLSRNVSEGNLRYGLHFMFSDSCTYRDNLFRRNSAGVAVMYTRHVVMEGNRFEENRGSAAYGLLLKEIDDSRIRGNIVADNTVGIYAEGSDRLRVEGNRFLRNGWAVRVMADCADGLFRGNDFIGNTFDVATNSENNPNRFVGNYWDRYRGYDLRRDGAGDVPFHPVRLFSLIMERSPVATVLLNSLFVSVLDEAEEAFPTLTPAALVDSLPRMHPVAWGTP